MNSSTPTIDPRGLPVSPDKEEPAGDNTHERAPRDATEDEDDTDPDTASNSGAVLTGNIGDASAGPDSGDDIEADADAGSASADEEDAPEGSDAVVHDIDDAGPPRSGGLNRSERAPELDTDSPRGGGS
ncbi:MAG: hypothetical protein EON55_21475 [Alphaproteobacteria bacterium]|nr:MAG: hypothetical protein EON55_21475 [Alphaproteobacteria bacterium]